jgi:hypothetical protein
MFALNKRIMERKRFKKSIESFLTATALNMTNGTSGTDEVGDGSEYGLRPNITIDYQSWGVAPGYGDKWPSAREALFHLSEQKPPI